MFYDRVKGQDHNRRDERGGSEGYAYILRRALLRSHFFQRIESYTQNKRDKIDMLVETEGTIRVDKVLEKLIQPLS